MKSAFIKIRHDKAEVQACRCQIRLQILDSERYCAALNPFIMTPVRSSDAERKFAINIHIAVEIGDHNWAEQVSYMREAKRGSQKDW